MLELLNILRLITSPARPPFSGIQATHRRLMLLYNALLEAQVPAELHMFNHSDHGIGLAPGDSDAAHWTGLLHRWLRRRKLLTQKSRCADFGRLLIDDRAPLARNFLTATTDAKFMIFEGEGPVAGVHLLKVHEVSGQHFHAGQGIFSLASSYLF